VSVRALAAGAGTRAASPLPLVAPIGAIGTAAFCVSAAILLRERFSTSEALALLSSAGGLLALALREFDRAARGVNQAARAAGIVRRWWPWAGALAITAAAPVSFALIMERYLPSGALTLVAVSASGLSWGVAALRRLGPDSLVRVTAAPWTETGLALGVAALSMVHASAWLIAKVDLALGRGPLPSTLTTGGAYVVSALSAVAAVAAVALVLALPRLTRSQPRGCARLALALVALPAAALLLTPAPRFGIEGAALAPAYLSMLAPRTLLATVVVVVAIAGWLRLPSKDEAIHPDEG
jgi:hypothetical protein